MAGYSDAHGPTWPLEGEMMNEHAADIPAPGAPIKPFAALRWYDAVALVAVVADPTHYGLPLWGFWMAYRIGMLMPNRRGLFPRILCGTITSTFGLTGVLALSRIGADIHGAALVELALVVPALAIARELHT